MLYAGWLIWLAAAHALCAVCGALLAAAVGVGAAVSEGLATGRFQAATEGEPRPATIAAGWQGGQGGG